MTRQCALLDLPRSTFYHVAQPVSSEELELMRLIDRCHLEHPYYGSRGIRDWLEDEGHRINRKRVQRLMHTMGVVALYPKRNLSRANQVHKLYPYLLRGRVIDRPNQVWATDVTYVPMARGFVYLVAIMDWYSRRVLSWRLSNTLETSFCIDALNEAIETYGAPQIFNTDQGSQFTSEEFTGVLKHHDIRISMDGKGRWVDNVFVERLWRSVKYEEVYLRAYESIGDARDSLGRYFAFPEAHRRRIRTSNMVERLNKEIKRRTRVATLFPNEASCLRLVSAVAMEISDEWETGRAYLTMEQSMPAKG